MAEQRHSLHGEIIDTLINSSSKKLTANFINKFLKKYNIDINYDNAVFLTLVVTGFSRDSANEPDYDNIKLLLEMGSDPTLMMSDHMLIYESSPINIIRLDTIFKMYGFSCKWGTTLDIDKLDNKLDCSCLRCEPNAYRR